MIKKNIIILISIFISLYLFNNEYKIDNYFRMNKDQLKIEEKLILNENDSFKKFSNLGLIYFFIGNEKIKQAIDNFEKALTINKDCLIKAYLGSSYTKLGKSETDLNLKVKYVNQGLKIMDEAYKKDKHNFNISILLVNNFIELPDNIFHRLKIADKIIDALLKNLNSFSKEEQAQILFLKSKINFKQSKKEEAIKLYKIIISEYKDTKYNELALLELKKYGVIK